MLATGHDGEVLRELGVRFPADPSERGEIGRADLVIAECMFWTYERNWDEGRGAALIYVPGMSQVAVAHCLMLIPPAISGYFAYNSK